MVIFDNLEKFGLLTELQMALEERVHQGIFPHINEDSKQFWRCHFVWTLRVHFCGGDIRQDYDISVGQALLDELAEREHDGKVEDFEFSESMWNKGGQDEHVGEMVKKVWKRHTKATDIPN
uniref:Uncharacterized protein n=1 Tax=Mycena chlorophos TaxID=658473 RepID=A0ABQ0M4I5_MYCCL|nr:predicted protein [Mycena chlorophos]